MKIGKLNSFVSDDISSSIERVIGNQQFSWYWRPSSAHGIGAEGEEYEDFQFIHLIYYSGEPQSESFEVVKPLLNQFEKTTGYTIKNIRKIKANLLTKQVVSDRILKQMIHTDVNNLTDKILSIVYYVNDSDGDTIIFTDDGHEITKSPIKGTAIYFPSSMLHRATPPSINTRRLVLNIVIEIE